VPAQPRLPISHTIHLVPFFRFLEDVGAPVERGIGQARLPAHIIDVPDCYAPTESVWGFIGTMAQQQGIDDLGLRVAHGGGLRMLGCGLTGEIDQAETLLRGLERFCRVIHRESSEMRCWLITDEAEARFHLHKTFGPATLGYADTEWLGLMAMLTAIQVFTGPRWQPTRIAIRSKGPVPRLAEELFPDTEFSVGSREIYIAFPRLALSQGRAPDHGDPRFVRPESASFRFAAEEPASDFAQRLRQCLQPHLFDGHPDIRLAAELLNTSTRTLQRRLAELGVTYSCLVDGARFELSKRMLTETDTTATEIAYAVGYSDPSHFARAFRRLASVSPREYRNQARQGGTR